MFSWFERLSDPYKAIPLVQPPQSIARFYLYYCRHIWPILLAILIFGVAVALIEVALFTFLGQLVDLAREAENPARFFEEHGATLAFMGFVALILRPIIFVIHSMLVNQSVTANFTALIRWQTHRYVLRQSLNFFQNDFAGRIANRIMQTGPSLRQSVVEATEALWYVLVYWTSSAIIFFQLDPRLIVPLMVWLLGFGLCIWYFVPRLKAKAAIMSEARSTLMGRIVDSYTNILTVKLFAHTDLEDGYARDAVEDHRQKFLSQLRLMTLLDFIQTMLNGILIAGTGGLALWLWSEGLITLGAIAVATGLVIRINAMSGWVLFAITGIFENIGTVQEGIESISKPLTVTDSPDAKPLVLKRGEIRFENVTFRYGRERGLMESFNLAIGAGEKVGLVGPSGAGKSTLVSILLRFHDLDGGRILIDGQDISEVTQDSLRSQIGLVTQDTSLLHRSIRDNIRYGRAEATEAEIVAAARQAQAHDFIMELEDYMGRRGYDAHAGERGVKLSGGQRQRIAIARVLLKNAPILILDEATAALDSEVEAAIQEQLYNLMAGKTVIAIAHRLSTIAAMDRLLIMDKGRIVEQGSHDELLRRGGLYANLWERQSGGFLFDRQEPGAQLAKPDYELHTEGAE